MKTSLFIYLSLVIYWTVGQEPPILTNYNRLCIRCLCHAATGYDLTLGCDKGYCGPFKISKIYWIDANNVTLTGDDPERAGAYEDCAISYQCAQRIVANYLAKFAKKETSTENVSVIKCTATTLKLSPRTISRIRQQGQDGIKETDCNEDGVTNCDDYSMINFNGGYQCQPPLNRNEAGRKWLERYRTCNPVDPQ